ncbi:hypothetical protein Rleg9DRAFT_0039 [Rhizobium leguminosarum bv. trifolii WSM597]|uniref:Uncharacterized protein n=1 Tax=Rhizobium leguminosarum bv. trifolii WSM597 TaxID=754764 RepID=I9N0D2_RHILT|nr:hypothetical protein [Rhizobium leguminosarum]EJB01309.1 hypothetical protein Rleg9DRAFT_0039 [Rhizobium leguminosarum bv. trifolii WSM597]
MSNDWYYVHQLALLAGFRLIVLANRIGCTDNFSRALHDRLADGLACAMARARSIMALQGEQVCEPDLEGITAFQLEGEKECFNRFQITLLDDLEIDFATREYRVNNGEWHYADCEGIEISYPGTIGLTDAELGGLGPIIRDISHETGICISAARIVCD